MKKILFNLQLMVTNKKEREKNRAKFVRLMLLFFGRRPPRHLMVTVELVGRRHSSSSCLFVVVFFSSILRASKLNSIVFCAVVRFVSRHFVPFVFQFDLLLTRCAFHWPTSRRRRAHF